VSRRKKNYPIVEVHWVDAEEHGEIGWNSTTDLLKLAKKECPTMTSVGYLVHQDANHLSLLSTYTPELCSSLEKIPMLMVISLHYLVRQGEVQSTADAETPE
jgi:hypothetical protein